MLKDAGATAVIVGHSERRADHGERDRDVKPRRSRRTGPAFRRSCASARPRASAARD
jgi:hypothetical protein